MSKKTVNMKSFLPRLEELFALLDKNGIKPYWNEGDTNTMCVVQAEDDGVSDYIYVNSQAVDTALEEGEVWVGHDVEDPKLLNELLNKVDGLNVDWDGTANNKICIKPLELNVDDCKWEVHPDFEPEYAFMNDVMKANPELSQKDIVDKLVANTAMLESEQSTKH